MLTRFWCHGSVPLGTNSNPRIIENAIGANLEPVHETQHKEMVRAQDDEMVEMKPAMTLRKDRECDSQFFQKSEQKRPAVFVWKVFKGGYFLCQ